MPDKIISILLPTVNRPLFLKKALESIAEQTIVNNVCEVIVSENGGDKASEAVCGEFSDLPIKYFYQEKQLSPAQHIKKVFNICSGNFIAFLSDDDWWAPGHLETAILSLNRHKSAAAVFSRAVYVVDEEIKYDRTIPAPAFSVVPASSFVKNEYVYKHHEIVSCCWLFTPFHISTIAGRRDVLASSVNKLYDEVDFYNSDRELFPLIAEEGDILFNDTPDTYIRWYDGNSTKKVKKEKLDEIFNIGSQRILHRAKTSIESLVEDWKGYIAGTSDKKVLNDINKKLQRISTYLQNHPEMIVQEKTNVSSGDAGYISDNQPGQPLPPDVQYSEISKRKNIAMKGGEFVNPELSVNNMDRYFVRTSIKKAIDSVLSQFPGTLLDLGCGEMPYKEYILNNSAVSKYIGLDIENHRYQENARPDLFWDGKTIPLDDNSVNNILATELFEHIPDPEAVMKEANRVLKPGGMMFLTVPFVWSLHTIPYDEYRYTPFSLERHLKNSGFDNIQVKALGGWNATLAQVIGLWTKRKPMSPEERQKYADMFFPLYKQLIENDEIPEKFTEGFLPTGFSCIAVKPLTIINMNKDYITTHNSGIDLEEIEDLITGGNYEQANKLLMILLEKNPTDVDALNNLAVVQSLMGDNDMAVKILENVLILEPMNSVAKENIQIFLENGSKKR
jgi:glycosyltransferase involved in cell wall biosynthesis/SAM-dependent methyltransferase